MAAAPEKSVQAVQAPVDAAAAPMADSAPEPVCSEATWISRPNSRAMHIRFTCRNTLREAGTPRSELCQSPLYDSHR
jgi:hypothetical protein